MSICLPLDLRRQSHGDIRGNSMVRRARGGCEDWGLSPNRHNFCFPISVRFGFYLIVGKISTRRSQPKQPNVAPVHLFHGHQLSASTLPPGWRWFPPSHSGPWLTTQELLQHFKHFKILEVGKKNQWTLSQQNKRTCWSHCSRQLPSSRIFRSNFLKLTFCHQLGDTLERT